ncbi:PhoP regulatory network protein YrbL [Ruegeria halocynthiae]|uniref:PhoP regulatory network protein YrbL n=1 Tax=Ruegeria halocynthiae TaxID=985054 RepID=A0A1H3AD74_9RHOB|nr:YrbL family protein [Ruegeria halocynthiae]SDX27657.1 PhoP regulatory network protein YrbL [Ruegeria halocynthiae]
MLFTAKTIDLSDGQPIANGTVRSVYDFPGQPDLLIKVFTRSGDRVSHRFGKRLAWKLFPEAQYRSTLKELECELRVSLKLGTNIEHSPLSRMLGVVQTSRGAGVVVERIAGLDGGLAPKLYEVCRNGLDDPALDALNVFVGQMFDLHIVARDVKSSNIVYGTRGAGPACFLIDGYGERNLIPLRSLSRRLNDRSLNKQFSLIAQKAGLTWNADQRAFSNS